MLRVMLCMLVGTFLLQAGTVVYFSPQHNITQKLMEEIAQETGTVRVAMYAFTDQDLAKVLVQAKKRGVDVEVIVDRSTIKSRSPVHNLHKNGIPVFVWNIEKQEKKEPRALMHDKFCVFGKTAVWTGSFNWTRQANRANQENVVVLDDPSIISAFEAEFEKIKRSHCNSYEKYMQLYPK